MLVGADGVLVHAGHHGAAAGRTDRRGSEGPPVADPFGGQLVQVRRPGSRGAVTTQIGADVLGQDPHDVWWSGDVGRDDPRGAEQQAGYAADKDVTGMAFHGVLLCQVRW